MKIIHHYFTPIAEHKDEESFAKSIGYISVKHWKEHIKSYLEDGGTKQWWCEFNQNDKFKLNCLNHIPPDSINIFILKKDQIDSFEHVITKYNLESKRIYKSPMLCNVGYHEPNRLQLNILRF